MNILTLVSEAASVWRFETCIQIFVTSSAEIGPPALICGINQLTLTQSPIQLTQIISSHHYTMLHFNGNHKTTLNEIKT